ncbi:MAG TPA: hypothetical protein VIO61_07630 [Anaerolineaceae bacterium]
MKSTTSNNLLRRIPLWVILVIVFILALFALWFFAARTQLPYSASRPLLYAHITENPPDLSINYTTGSWKSSVKLDHDADGNLIPYCGYFGNSNSFLSPAGDYFTLRTGADQNQIRLYSTHGGSPVTLAGKTLSPSGFPVEGFSKSGKMFAYSTLEKDGKEVATRVVNLRGQELLKVTGAVFASFAPDESRLLVMPYNPTNGDVNGIVSVNLKGEQKALVSLTLGALTRQGLFTHPFYSADGEQVYFFIEKKLYRISTLGGEPSVVYTFKQAAGIAYLTPDGSRVALLDLATDNSVALASQYVPIRVAILDPKSGMVTDLSENTPFTMSRESFPILCEQSMTFSPNGKSLAVQVNGEKSTKLVLTDLEGKNPKTLAEAATFTFEFTPDSRYLLYTVRKDLMGPDFLRGSLYSQPVDGKAPVMIDENVFSFRVVPTGKEVIYARTVQDLNQQLTTEVFRANLDGTGKTSIAGGVPGLIAFLKN